MKKPQSTLGLAYNEHFDVKKIAHCTQVLVVAELIVAGVLPIVQCSFRAAILSNPISRTH